MFGGFNDQDAFGANWNLDEIQQLEDITAGGFIEDDAIPPHDNLALNADKVAPTKQAWMPAKIGMIVSAWKGETSYIQFFNKIPDIVKILGRIEKYKSTEENTMILIDDGTGRVPCIYVHPSDMTSFRQRELDKVLHSQKMVVVYGTYNPIYSVKCPALIIFKIREVCSPDEFALHELDVMHMIIRNERDGTPLQTVEVGYVLQDYAPKSVDLMGNPVESGMPTIPTAAAINMHNTAAPGADSSVNSAFSPGVISNASSVMATTMTPGGASVSTPGTAGANTPDCQGPLTLMKYIAHLLAAETRNGNLNGLHVGEITRLCKQQRNFQSISEQHVRKVLAELEKDATVYQTVDAHTFASTDA
ncbi:replication A2, putative [Babesia ovata]|uniref:Replication A2, putative n=1 Tax=Babesia ovata TaxID=189622 RepID=A0A2H6KDP3_9APIC|nr:replication A2, putative [Babesia ovata]GBE61094.1 replication A2, putative [Babesia ovata]